MGGGGRGAGRRPGLPLLGLPGSALLAIAAERGLRAVPEAFADRGYTAAGTLVARSAPGAVLSDPDEVAGGRCGWWSMAPSVVDGTDIEVRAESICVHGDSPGAVQMARAVASALRAAGVTVRAFG